MLQAVPDNNSVFVGWTGADPPDANPAAVTVDQDKTVTVEFDPISNFPPPAGQGLCWTWIPTLLGSGGYAWNGTCGNAPPRGRNTTTTRVLALESHREPFPAAAGASGRMDS